MKAKHILNICLFSVSTLSVKVYKRLINFTFIYLSATVFFFITGCTTGNLNSSRNIETVEENTLTRVSDIPFLINSKIHIEDSLILGEGKSWSGQLLITVRENKRDVFNYYAKNLGDYGWKEQTTIRGNTSILNYLGPENRVAIITIQELPSLFDATTVLISVSPFTEAFEEKVGDYINEKYLEIIE